MPPRSDGSGSIDEAVVTTTERLAPRPAEVGDAGPEAGDGQGVVGGESGHRVPPHRLRSLLVAAGLYLVLALVVW